MSSSSNSTPAVPSSLATTLKDTVVIQGDATNPDQLRDATSSSDVFCALTNDDEVNIMSSLMAKRFGVRRVMTLIGKPAYAELMRTSEIDVAISPQQSTTSSLLTHVRRGDVARVHSLRRGAAEAMEAVARGDAKTSRIIGRPVKAIKLPKGVTVGAIVRGETVVVTYENVVIEPDDHLILFLTDKQTVSDVERLFQVGFTFF